MIDINDYNREDLIASCLMEAANVMSESAGRNGVADRYRDTKLENVRKEISRLEAKGNLSEAEEDKLFELQDAAIYLRGVHGDSKSSKPGPKWFGKTGYRQYHHEGNIVLGKDMADDSKRISDGRTKPRDGQIFSPSGSLMYYGSGKYDRSDRKPSEIHKKINERARKAMGESAYDHLDFADAVLDILDDYDY